MKILAQGTFDQAGELVDWALVGIDYANYTIVTPDDGYRDGGAPYDDGEISAILQRDAMYESGFDDKYSNVDVQQAGDLYLITGQREKSLWSKEWPTEPGYYWFYGYLNPGVIIQEPNLHLIHFPYSKMIEVDYCISGIRKGEALGLWTPAFPPEVPDLSELTEEK